MKKMSKVIFVALVAVMSCLSVHAGDYGNKEGRSKKWKERREERKQEMFKELNLTDEQKMRLEENRKMHREGTDALRKNMKEYKDSMREEIGKDVLDTAKIDQIQAQMKETQEQMMDSRLQSILEVRSILSPEQFKKFSAKMEERKERSFKHRWDKKDGDKSGSEHDSEDDPSDGLSSQENK